MRKIKSILQQFRVGLLRKSLSEVIVDFGRYFGKAGRVVVLLPSDKIRRSEVLSESEQLSLAFPASEICLISMPDDNVRQIARREGYRIFTPNRTELSWYDFPNSSFLTRIRNLKSSLVLDLDPSRSCFNAAVSLASGAPLRVGVFGSWGRPVHNVEIKSDNAGSQSEVIRTLLGVLSTLGTGKTE